MKFKIGDKVIVTEGPYKQRPWLNNLVGKHVTIQNVFKCANPDIGCYDIGEEYIIPEDNLELYHQKFKVGDKVKIIGTKFVFKTRYIGSVYTIKDIERDLGEGRGPRYVMGGYPDPGYIFYENELELVKPKFDIKNYPGSYVMHCKTEEDAWNFCRYLHCMGKKWVTDRTYIEVQNFHASEGGTVYFYNEGKCVPYVRYYKDRLDNFSDKHIILNFEDFDWSDIFMKKEFTKKDLKNGDFVKLRDGSVGIALVDINAITFGRQYMALNDLHDDLTNNLDDNCDIVAIRRPNAPYDCIYEIFSNKKGELVYERKEVEEMTLEEVCKALGKEIKIVKK
jgi:hypothetical protein